MFLNLFIRMCWWIISQLTYLSAILSMATIVLAKWDVYFSSQSRSKLIKLFSRVSQGDVLGVKGQKMLLKNIIQAHMTRIEYPVCMCKLLYRYISMSQCSITRMGSHHIPHQYSSEGLHIKQDWFLQCW